MSIVTSITLVVSMHEDRARLREINAWLADKECYGETECYELRPVDVNAFGGNKLATVEVWAGGFNMFGQYEDAFCAFVMAMPWETKSTTVLVVHYESAHTKVLRPMGWEEEVL